MFLVNHYRKIGEFSFFIFQFLLFVYFLISNNEGACDARAPAPYEKGTDHLFI